MPSTRRIKTLVLAVAVAVVLILYYSSNARNSRDDFYERTLKAMDEKKVKQDNSHAAAQAVLENAKQIKGEAIEEGPSEPKAPPKAGESKTKPLDTGKDQSANGVAGRIKFKGPDGEKVEEELLSGEEPATNLDAGKKAKSDEEDKDTVLTDKLTEILKRSPIIIFSKSYCPYSRKAKAILLDKYNIIPAPFVVELDKETSRSPADDSDLAAPTLGERLQAYLAKSYNRKTVPNILINGRSIGGGDDVEKLDRDGALEAKIKELGGKRIMQVKRREED